MLAMASKIQTIFKEISQTSQRDGMTCKLAKYSNSGVGLNAELKKFIGCPIIDTNDNLL